MYQCRVVINITSHEYQHYQPLIINITSHQLLTSLESLANQHGFHTVHHFQVTQRLLQIARGFLIEARQCREIVEAWQPPAPRGTMPGRHRSPNKEQLALLRLQLVGYAPDELQLPTCYRSQPLQIQPSTMSRSVPDWTTSGRSSVLIISHEPSWVNQC